MLGSGTPLTIIEPLAKRMVSASAVMEPAEPASRMRLCTLAPLAKASSPAARWMSPACPLARLSEKMRAPFSCTLPASIRQLAAANRVALALRR